MKKSSTPRKNQPTPKAVFRQPDLDHAKAAVLNSLTCLDGRRGCRHAIDTGIARSHGSPSIGPSCFVTASIRSSQDWHLEP